MTIDLSRLVVSALVAVAPFCGGCLSETDLGIGQPQCPPFENFRAVNNLLERRCGTLDCHGDSARPFIVYSQSGFRRPGGDKVVSKPSQYYSGGQEATADFEVQGTYQSACALEPEKMDLVAQGGDLLELSLIRKPRLSESHKGGRVWGAGTKGEQCLVNWLSGKLSTGDADLDLVNAEPCVKELEQP